MLIPSYVTSRDYSLQPLLFVPWSLRERLHNTLSQWKTIQGPLFHSQKKPGHSLCLTVLLCTQVAIPYTHLPDAWCMRRDPVPAHASADKLACLPAGRSRIDQASRGGAVQPQNPSVHFIFSMIFIASWQLSVMSYLFVCFSFQLQRKLHKLMALFYSCLNYNLSNCALCTKGFQSQLHGQMDRKVHGSRCTSNNEN